MGIYNATSALLQQMPGETQGRGGKTVADVTNNDFEHFPTREDVCPRYLAKNILIKIGIYSSAENNFWKNLINALYKFNALINLIFW